jgi:hypothetical protein
VRQLAYTQGNIATIDVARDVAAAKLVLGKLGYEANCVAMNADVFALDQTLDPPCRISSSESSRILVLAC